METVALLHEVVDAAWVWGGFELTFALLYCAESLLKMRVLSVAHYFAVGANRFDFAVTWVPVLIEAGAFWRMGDGVAFDADIGRVVMLSRLLRLLRLFNHSQNFRVLAETLARMVPLAASLFGSLWLLMFTFSLVGVDAFGGAVYHGNAALAGTAFADNDYWDFNFNDMLSGMVTLWCLLVVNDWAVIMDGVIAASGKSSWWKTYFMVFYIIGAVVCMGVLTSFIIDSYLVSESTRALRASGEQELLRELAGLRPRSRSRSRASAGGGEGEGSTLLGGAAGATAPGEELSQLSPQRRRRAQEGGKHAEQKCTQLEQQLFPTVGYVS